MCSSDHVTWTFDSNNFGRFYIDGNQIGTSQYNGPFAGIYNAALARADGANKFLNGQLNDVLIYNRVLTESEVLQNYNVTRKRFGL